MSSAIDMLAPESGEPLPNWLARPAASASARDSGPAPSAGADGEIAPGDIVRQAEQAIAGVPLDPGRGSGPSADMRALRTLIVARLNAGAAILHAVASILRGMLATIRHGIAARRRPGNLKLYVAFGAAALGLTLAVVYLPARLGSRASLSSDFPGTPEWQPRTPTAPEERPAAGTGAQFTQANIRYCTFQQIRLEALGPVTEGADIVVFNALVEDWNARCTRYRYKAAEKDAVDGEAVARRTLLEAEGRAIMTGWRRKIVTTVQRRPASAAGSDPAEYAATLQTAGDAAAMPARQAIEPLPLLITLGRAAADEPDRDTGLSLKAPSLALLRADVATRVQRRLNELGYTISPVDGTWGAMSRNALRRFKEANGLLGNDAFDAETVTRLFSTSAVTASAAASRPDDGSAAIETIYPPPPAAGMNPLNRADGQRIQQRLAELGYYSGRGDGLWGAASRVALRSFKLGNGLPDNDEWDAMAEAVLFDEHAARASDPVGSLRSPGTPPAAGAAVPLPPKRPPPPAASAKAGEPAAPTAQRDTQRPPGLIQGPPLRPAK